MSFVLRRFEGRRLDLRVAMSVGKVSLRGPIEGGWEVSRWMAVGPWKVEDLPYVLCLGGEEGEGYSSVASR